MNVQAMFDRYNRRYWQGRLPGYTVILSDKYNGGYCEKRERIIYINPVAAELQGGIRLLLLHEMAHAAVKAGGHGKIWMNEISRLIRLGVPLKKRLAEYERAVPRSQVLGEFYDAALEAGNGVTWPQVRRELGYKRSYTDKHGRAVSRYDANFLKKARREWFRGRAFKERCAKNCQ
jgi:hypothetical protein